MGHEDTLNAAPKPQIDWYVEASLTTMSALPMAPGVTKLIGLGDKLVYVKSLLLSHVVDHFIMSTVSRMTKQNTTYNVIDLVLGEGGPDNGEVDCSRYESHS